MRREVFGNRLRLMPWLLILRGVSGVGKSEVVTSLIRQLGSAKACDLNMDVTEPAQIEINIETALKFEVVIAHLYDGRKNTLEPKTWISRFKDVGYQVLSFRLEISREAGKTRARDRKHSKWITSEIYDSIWDRSKRSPFIDFPSRAEIEEIPLDAEKLSADAMCGLILSKITSRNKKDAP